MGLDFDVYVFCRNLRSTKPPYECPVNTCDKVYKSIIGLQYHLFNFDHDNPQAPTPGPSCAASTHTTPTSHQKHTGGGSSRKKHRGSKYSADKLSSPLPEGLTYAEAQKMVEFDIGGGRSQRVSIFEPLEILSLEEFQASIPGQKVDDVLVPVEPGRRAQIQPEGHDTAARGSVATTVSKLPEPTFRMLQDYDIPDAPPLPNSYIRFIEKSADELDAEVEYDADEEDGAWLELANEKRESEGLSAVSEEQFELLMDRLEKESYFQMANNGQDSGALIDDDAVCCICMDGECQNSNVILFCDMCNLAVHQDCYGVPYIPEGQWLCRRCLQSPSRAVECVLCPNNGGAFKQTDRGTWAHVVCALWIPEVRFANTVFLEPIDSIETIPAARWKLTCYICKQKGVGACIQCHKSSCYAAFHVTCAQQANLHMKMDTVRDSGATTGEPAILVQKTAYCDTHTPADAETRPRVRDKEKAGSECKEDSKEKMKKARKLLAKKRSSVPVISIPTIPPDRIQEIASLVQIARRNQFIQRLLAYWTLKRQHRHGVPLLRRLQTSSHPSRRPDAPVPQREQPEAKQEDLLEQLKYWQSLRQDLERARLLCELVRKREKLKKELVKIKEQVVEHQLRPLACFLSRVLEQIQSKDVGDIFGEPVDQEEVTDYDSVVSHPMDLATMRHKLEDNQYDSLDHLEADFALMIANCMAYNAKDTVFYRAAVRMRDQGGAVIRQARRDFAEIGFDVHTGLLMSDKPAQAGGKVDTDEALVEEVDSYLGSEERKDCPLDQQLSKLLELYDSCLNLKHAVARAKRTKQIKTEITTLRRKIALEQSGGKRSKRQEDDPPTQHGDSSAGSSDSDNDETYRTPPKSRRTRAQDSAGVSHSETPASTLKPGKSAEEPRSLEPVVTPGVPEPVTPSKDTPPGVVSPHTGSPSGVNRRTAVLFTRKAAAAAFRKPEAPPASTKRRVGRPRKNLDAALGVSLLGLGQAGGPDIPEVPSSESFRVYRSGAEIPAETDEESEGSSSESSSSSSAGSSDSEDSQSSNNAGPQLHAAQQSLSESSADEGGVHSEGNFEPLELVWAKCRGYPWYPALMIDPKMPRSGFLNKGVPIPAPPSDVLALATNYPDPVYLVLFFDTKRTWQWLPRNKLEPLLGDSERDQQKVCESRKPAERKAVRKAYQEAMLYRRQVTGQLERQMAHSSPEED